MIRIIFIFPLMLGLQSRPYLQATRAVVSPPGEARDEASIYLDLCRASGAPLFGSRIAQRALEFLRWKHSRRKRHCCWYWKTFTGAILPRWIS